MQQPNFFEEPKSFFAPFVPSPPAKPPAVLSGGDAGTKIWTYVLIAIVIIAIIVLNIYFFTDITRQQDEKQS